MPCKDDPPESNDLEVAEVKSCAGNATSDPQEDGRDHSQEIHVNSRRGHVKQDVSIRAKAAEAAVITETVKGRVKQVCDFHGGEKVVMMEMFFLCFLSGLIGPAYP